MKEAIKVFIAVIIYFMFENVCETKITLRTMKILGIYQIQKPKILIK